MSDNGGPIESWLENTVETTALFDGENGHTYQFFSVATDNVGHQEEVPTSPDTQTTVTATPWNNSRDPFDVDNDTFVVPLDALLIINDLNLNGARDLPVPPDPLFTPPPFLDVSGNNSVEPLDALLVINELNLRGQGEGEADPPLELSALAAEPRTVERAEAALMSVLAEDDGGSRFERTVTRKAQRSERFRDRRPEHLLTGFAEGNQTHGRGVIDGREQLGKTEGDDGLLNDDEHLESILSDICANVR
jgi:hypothetical protein